MQIMEKDELLRSVMQGRLDFLRSFSAYSPLPAAAFQKNTDDSFYYSSGINYAPCNGVMHSKDGVISEQAIERAFEFFHIRKLPFIWWTSSKNLEKKGFQFGGILKGIALDISNERKLNPPAASLLRVRIISAKEDLSAFASIAVKGFGMNLGLLEQFQAVHTAGMENGEQVHFLALFEDVPVGTATLSTSDSSAGIWNLATLSEYRKRGVGTALVASALAEAKKLHYKHVMAILMPKRMAWGLFSKLGFKEVCPFPCYIYGASAEELEI